MAPKLKYLLLETRPQFLTLIPCVLALGVSLAVLEGHFNGPHLALALLGCFLVHGSSNVLNDYTDWVRGTDKLVRRTPFSGGSGLIAAGALTPGQVLWLGIGLLASALVIGIYFISVYPVLAWVVLPGGLLAAIYTPILTRVYITEVFPGLGLGFLPVIGAYVTQMPPGEVAIPAAVYWAAIPPAILVSGLLWINEIPDYEADLATGRHHAVILLGRRGAAAGYAVLLVLTYIFVVVPVALGKLPPGSLLGLLTIPVAVRAAAGALRNYDRHAEIIPALQQNVVAVLGTPALMAAGIFITRLAG